MYKLPITALCFTISTFSYAQTPTMVSAANITTVQTILLSLTPTANTTPKANGPYASPCLVDAGMAYPRLVSTYTYHRIFEKDMATVLSFDNAVNTGTSYASVSVDADKSTFAFAPLHKGLFNGHAFPNRNIIGLVNIQLKGKVNSDEVASIYEGKSFSKDYSVSSTIILFWGREKYDTGGQCR